MKANLSKIPHWKLDCIGHEIKKRYTFSGHYRDRRADLSGRITVNDGILGLICLGRNVGLSCRHTKKVALPQVLDLAVKRRKYFIPELVALSRY